MVNCPPQRQKSCVGAVVVPSVSELSCPSGLRTGQENNHTKTKK